MQSLTDLNNFGNLTLDLPDDRPSGVVFNRMPPLQPYDIIGTINSTSNLVGPGIDITEIINYQQANVRYRVRIVTGSSPLLTGSTISWASLPTGITLSQSGTTYTLSGIKTVAHWESVKEFLWTLPANYASFPNWYLDVAVLYYDSALGQERVVDWEVYDPRFYWIAQLEETSSSLTCSGMKVKNIESAQIFYGEVMCFNHIGPLIKFEAALAATPSTLSCTGQSIHIESGAASITAKSSCFLYYYGQGSYVIETVDLAPNTYIWVTVDATGPYTVDFGDGTQGQGGPHLYTTGGKKYISFQGGNINFAYISAGRYAPDLRDKTLRILDFGYTTQVNLQGETSLIEVPTVLSSTITSLYNAFGSTAYNNQQQNVSNASLNNIRYWDTSNVTNMSNMLGFTYGNTFNQPIQDWDTSNVIDMSFMFYGASAFNQPLNNWNVGKVTNMSSMFSGATSFDQPLNQWDTSKVTNMSNMFASASSFNRDLSAWDVHLIPTQPTGFDSLATSWVLPRPNWGTTGS